MQKQVMGWILIIAGGLYIGVLVRRGAYWLIDRTPVEVNIPILVVYISLICGGVYLLGSRRGSSVKDEERKEKSDGTGKPKSRGLGG